ncbi:hypothetical protein [Streptomyces sp. NPDC047315]|uniref:hypothetical protein n=1 Tax=Streptomyces sp. NPDC047315 TaxID=3155142 RepID=UPI0033F2D8FC
MLETGVDGGTREPVAVVSDQEPCDLVTVPTRQGLEAVDILRRTAAPAVGPVLHDGDCDTLGFLVPSGTAGDWDVPGSACTRTEGVQPRLPGHRDRDRDRDRAAAPACDRRWLLPPGGGEEVTDPAALRAALGEAARLIEAADRCN